MTTNLFAIANVKQLRTYVVLEFYCLFFRTSWGVGVLNSAILNSFHNRVEFGTILEGLRNFREGGLNTPNPPRYATDVKYTGCAESSFTKLHSRSGETLSCVRMIA